MHFDHKHNWDPDNGAGEHQPSKHHGPGRVAVRAIGHGLPLVKAEAEDKLGRKEEHTREGGEAALTAQPCPGPLLQVQHSRVDPLLSHPQWP